MDAFTLSHCALSDPELKTLGVPGSRQGGPEASWASAPPTPWVSLTVHLPREDQAPLLLPAELCPLLSTHLIPRFDPHVF